MIWRVWHLVRWTRLIIKAGVVWGVRGENPQEFEAAILATPLKYELLKLQAERERGYRP